MKKNSIFTIISLFSFQLLMAQAYIPLAVEGAHWIVCYDKIATPIPVDELWEYYSTGDTSINDINYKKVYKRDLVVTQEGPPFEASGPYELFGTIRDDSINKKVYAIRFSSYDECPVNEDFLLYDFSLSINQTAVLCIVPTFLNFVIEDIYNSEVLGFSTRVFDSYDDFYEGMGSNFGLFEDMFAPVDKSNGKYIFRTSLGYYCRESPCFLFVSTNEKLESTAIRIFPNPANDFIYISGNNLNEISSISVINNMGQEMISKNTEINKIDVSKLAPGFYIVELTIKNNIIQKKITIL